MGQVLQQEFKLMIKSLFILPGRLLQPFLNALLNW